TIFDPEKNFRDISALVRRDTLQVIDIPTTLLAISTSVDGYSQSKTVEGQAHLDREFARFRRVFEYWKSVSADREEENSQSDKAYIKFLWEKVVIDTLPPKYTDV
ncbi:MAG TPA: hypothetical protein VG224_24885, partial [Reyranella sp.]|nr:hypothetical protein [Reyranella sp.]